MTIRQYFMSHPRRNDAETIEAIAGVDDALLYCGVPIDAWIYRTVKAGLYDVEIPEESIKRLREIGGFCG